MEKIHECGIRLEKWNKELYGHVRKKIVEKEKVLKRLLMGQRNMATIQRMKSCRKELDELLRREEVMWKQRPCDM